MRKYLEAMGLGDFTMRKIFLLPGLDRIRCDWVGLTRNARHRWSG